MAYRSKGVSNVSLLHHRVCLYRNSGDIVDPYNFAISCFIFYLAVNIMNYLVAYLFRLRNVFLIVESYYGIKSNFIAYRRKRSHNLVLISRVGVFIKTSLLHGHRLCIDPNGYVYILRILDLSIYRMAYGIFDFFCLRVILYVSQGDYRQVINRISDFYTGSDAAELVSGIVLRTYGSVSDNYLIGVVYPYIIGKRLGILDVAVYYVLNRVADTLCLRIILLPNSTKNNVSVGGRIDLVNDVIFVICPTDELVSDS